MSLAAVREVADRVREMLSSARPARPRPMTFQSERGSDGAVIWRPQPGALRVTAAAIVTAVTVLGLAIVAGLMLLSSACA